jgi:gluconolactonase
MKLREIASGLRFPEGPVALPDGTFLVVEIARGTLTRIEADGHQEVVAETGGGPDGAD